GFSLHNFRIDATQALIKAGLRASADSDDVVLASNGQSVLVHVKLRDALRIRKIVRFLQVQDWIDVIFTDKDRPTPSGRYWRGRRNPVEEMGWVPGTLSLQLIKQTNAHRSPDILFTLRWSSDVNSFGVPGKHYTDGSGNSRPLTGAASGHGSLSPWLGHNKLILWGPDFKQRVTIRTAAGNVDIAPTVLILKHDYAGESLAGRALKEALRDGPDEEKVQSKTTVFETKLLRTQASSLGRDRMWY